MGLGVRAASRAAGVHRDTVTAYRRQWLTLRPTLQRAYDALWSGDGEECDRITADLPEPAVVAMLNAWVDDYSDEPGPKSGWHAGYEDTPQAPEAPTTEHEAAQQGEVLSPSLAEVGPDGEHSRETIGR